MVAKADQERVRMLLKEAIPMLCKKGISFAQEFCIEALVGITLDNNDVFLVNIKENVKNNFFDTDMDGSEQDENFVDNTYASTPTILSQRPSSSRRKRKKPNKRKAVNTVGSDVDQLGLSGNEDGALVKKGKFTNIKKTEASGKVTIANDEVNRPMAFNDNLSEASTDDVQVKHEPEAGNEYHSDQELDFSLSARIYDDGSHKEEEQSTSQLAGNAVPVEGFVSLKRQPGCFTTEADKILAQKYTAYSGNASRPLVCTICNKLFQTKYTILIHILGYHLKVPRYECPHCDSKFVWHMMYKKHIEKCEMEFALKRNLTASDNHEIIAEGEEDIDYGQMNEPFVIIPQHNFAINNSQSNVETFATNTSQPLFPGAEVVESNEDDVNQSFVTLQNEQSDSHTFNHDENFADSNIIFIE